MSEFIKEIKKVNGPRKHRVTNTLGVKNAFSYYRKIRPKESKYVLTECQYLKIIRLVNNILRQVLISGEEVVFPEKMGKLELRKTRAHIEFKNNKLKTNLPVDWKSTLQLWEEDSESYLSKRLVRFENKEIFRVFYNKYYADYPNKTFYTFHTNRNIKLGLKKNIKDNTIDALLLYAIKNGKDN